MYIIKTEIIHHFQFLSHRNGKNLSHFHNWENNLDYQLPMTKCIASIQLTYGIIELNEKIVQKCTELDWLKFLHSKEQITIYRRHSKNHSWKAAYKSAESPLLLIHTSINPQTVFPLFIRKSVKLLETRNHEGTTAVYTIFVMGPCTPSTHISAPFSWNTIIVKLGYFNLNKIFVTFLELRSSQILMRAVKFFEGFSASAKNATELIVIWIKLLTQILKNIK